MKILVDEHIGAKSLADLEFKRLVGKRHDRSGAGLPTLEALGGETDVPSRYSDSAPKRYGSTRRSMDDVLEVFNDILRISAFS